MPCAPGNPCPAERVCVAGIAGGALGALLSLAGTATASSEDGTLFESVAATGAVAECPVKRGTGARIAGGGRSRAACAASIVCKGNAADGAANAKRTASGTIAAWLASLLRVPGAKIAIAANTAECAKHDANMLPRQRSRAARAHEESLENEKCPVRNMDSL